MRALAWPMVRASGVGRMLLVAGCTAIVSALLLVALAVLRLPAWPDELLFAVVREPGTRGGMVLATVLCCVPPMLLLDQAVRLGTAARERRLAALRLAGATPGEVRALGAAEVGVPSLAGGVLGVGLFRLLRATLGGVRPGAGHSGPLKLVPTSVSPVWWEFALVVAGVGLLGAVVGVSAGRGVITSPLGVVRRQKRRAPRPWGAFVMVAGLFVGYAFLHRWYVDRVEGDSTMVGLVAVGLVMLGAIAIAPWVTYRLGRFVGRHARGATGLLAAARLVADPRSAGRAAAAVGGIGLVAGGSAVIRAVVAEPGYQSAESINAVTLIASLLLVAVVAVVFSLTVHSIEALLERRRSVAALSALGTPRGFFARAQMREAAVAAVPTAAAGVVLGGVAVGFAGSAGGDGVAPLTIPLVGLAAVLTTVAVWLATLLSALLTRRWRARASDPANLRTE